MMAKRTHHLNSIEPTRGTPSPGELQVVLQILWGEGGQTSKAHLVAEVYRGASDAAVEVRSRPPTYDATRAVVAQVLAVFRDRDWIARDAQDDIIRLSPAGLLVARHVADGCTMADLLVHLAANRQFQLPMLEDSSHHVHECACPCS